MKSNQSLILAESILYDSEFERSNCVEAYINMKEASVLLQTLAQFPD